MLLHVWVLVIKKNKMEHQHYPNFTLFSKTQLVQYKKELPVTCVGGKALQWYTVFLLAVTE